MGIGQMAKATDISEYTLRYYERKGLIRVKRDDAGRRCYEESDIEWIKFLKRLKDTGMFLKDIREYVLEQQRKWAEYLGNLDDKIAFYKRSIGSSI